MPGSERTESFASVGMNLDEKLDEIDKSTSTIVAPTDRPSSAAAVPTPNPAPPPPLPGPFDTGLMPWLQVLGSFGLWTNSWGVFSAFGEFQTYYENGPLSHKSSSQIAWIGGIQAFLLLFLGAMAGTLYDAGYLRFLMIAGNGFIVFGLFMTSLCTDVYWQYILAQGITVGLGAGLLFTPSIAIIPQWFKKRKALANGLAASGSGIGGVVYPIAFRNLERSIGFGWAVRVMAFMALFVASVILLTIRTKVPKAPKVRDLFQFRAFTEPPYTLFCTGCFFGFLGIYAPWFYIGPYAKAMGMDNSQLVSYLVVFVNVGSVLGRIGLGLFTDKVGAMNMSILTAVVSGVLGFCWIPVHELASLIVWAIFYGAIAGSFLATNPMVVPNLTSDMRLIGTRVGQFCMIASFAVLTGEPITGAIQAQGFIGVQVFVGAFFLVAACILIVAKYTARVDNVFFSKL